MTVPKLNYISILSPCKLMRLSHLGSSFWMPSSEVTTKPFSQSYTKFFVPWSLVRLRPVKIFLRWNHKWEFPGDRSELNGERLKISHLNISRPLHSTSHRLFPPTLNSRHRLLAFSSFIAPSSCVSTFCLWISAGRKFLAFKNPITDCTSLVAKFSFLYSSLTTTKNGEKLLYRNMQYTCSCWHTEDNCPW